MRKLDLSKRHHPTECQMKSHLVGDTYCINFCEHNSKIEKNILYCSYSKNRIKMRNKFFKENFVSKSNALLLQEIGFKKFMSFGGLINDEFTFHPDSEIDVNLPLFQQVTQWFLEEHEIHVYANPVYISLAIGECHINTFLPHASGDLWNLQFKSREKAYNKAIEVACKRIIKQRSKCKK